MRILIADDDAISRTALAAMLKKHGHEVLVTVNGAQAWQAMQQPGAPRLVILDWIMPELHGIEVCRRLRAEATSPPPYIIMLTVKDEKADIIAGLDAGANDYLVKPCNPDELRARVDVGRRVVELQDMLAAKVKEQRRSQTELGAARTRYFDLYDLAPMGYCTLDAHGLVLEANHAAATLLGVAPAALVTQPLARFILPEDQNIYDRHTRQLLETGAPQACELRLRQQDGTMFWAHLTCTAVPAGAADKLVAAGAPACHLIVSDISERKRMEEVQLFLAQTSSGTAAEPFFNTLARYLAENLGMDFVCIDRLEGDGLTARTVAVWCDGRFEDNLTYALADTPCGEVVGKTVCCFPASVCQFFPRDQVLRDLRAESYVGVTLFDHAGRPIGLIAVIGRGPLKHRAQAEAVLKMAGVRAAGELERLAVEAALRESERTLNEAQRIARIGSYVTDIPTGMWQGSAMLYDIFGIDATFVRNIENWGKLMAPGYENEMVEYYHRVVRERGKFNKDYEIIRPCDGQRRWVSAQGEFTFAADGTPLIQKGTIQDITERKLAEAELQKMQKLQSVGTLAGGIAHDFNNILMGLFGNISLAKDELAPEHPGYPLLLEAEKSMQWAMRLSKQLLTFAKGGEPVKECVNLGALVEEVARFDLSGSQSKLVYQQAPDLWLAEVDKGQIQQVVANLIINARQAMPTGGHVHVTLANAVLAQDALPGIQPGKYVKVSVRDEGTGIEPNVLDRIFDPYFTTKQAGSGLGLATAYAIIHKHGGHIGVVSELGHGTTFTFHVPACAAPHRVDAQTAAVASARRDRPARILVMDDEEIIRAIVARMLHASGYAVATAVGGREAIEMYCQARQAGAPFDAVIMDLTIPGGIGGKEAIKDLLALDPRARVIVSSGYADDPVMANFADYGFKGVAAKPYTLAELRDIMRRVLQ